MGNVLKIPDINPIQFYQAGREFFGGKNQFFIDEDWFTAQTAPWYTKRFYTQKWQRTDPSIYLQVQANFGPIEWKVVDCTHKIIMQGVFTEVIDMPPGDIYQRLETSIQLAAPQMADVSKFFIYIYAVDAGTGGLVTQWISEPQLLDDSFPETLLFQYKYSLGDWYDVWFNGLNQFSFRCEARVRNYQPGSITKVYSDQYVNLTQLSRYSYDSYQLSIGYKYGVPDYMIKKVNTFISFESMLIEGKAFGPSDGATWEVNRLDQYPMAGYSIQIQPSKNLYYNYSDTDSVDDVAVVYNIDGKVMGTFNNTYPSDVEIQILSTE